MIPSRWVRGRDIRFLCRRTTSRRSYYGLDAVDRRKRKEDRTVRPAGCSDAVLPTPALRVFRRPGFPVSIGTPSVARSSPCYSTEIATCFPQQREEIRINTVPVLPITPSPILLSNSPLEDSPLEAVGTWPSLRRHRSDKSKFHAQFDPAWLGDSARLVPCRGSRLAGSSPSPEGAVNEIRAA